MSEYASSKHSKHEALLEATIFDDALLDDMAEKLGSYDEARRHLGIKAPEYEPPSIEAEPGAFLKLGARAIAVQGILEGINIRNRAGGASKTAEVVDSDFNRRYQNPQDILSGMSYSASRSEKEREKYLNILNATTAMIDAGFDPDHVTFYRNRLQDEVKPYEGAGPRSVTKRNKLARKVQNTADHSKA